jgi:hypothetical protein
MTAIANVFAELIHGNTVPGTGLSLNSGDPGLLRSLESLSAHDASQAVNGGATIAAQVEHVRQGLANMTRWSRDGGDPFLNPTWDDAWRITTVTDAEWKAILDGLRAEAKQWLDVLTQRTPSSERDAELLAASATHVAYHLGAIRQIARSTRGPRGGTFE